MFATLHRFQVKPRQILIPPQRSILAELLDSDIVARRELAENFRDIRRVNRLLGGTRAVLRQLPMLFNANPAKAQVTILDLATGVADIPVAIANWANWHGYDVRIVASDASDAILDLARDATAGHPEIAIARFDARAIPLPDQQFDIVLCSLSLHHFAPDEAVLVLREMRRLARTGVVVNDLYRSWVGYAAAWMASRLTTRNRLTRNDAPLSVLRAYTPDELAEMLRNAGFRNSRISKHLWFRMTAVEQLVPDEQ
jgi:ubiquinone/menaquinone biosynthesis C-methylase UbiE